MSLNELLVAITIRAILIFGATQVYVDSKNMYEVNETSARLQETARYALSVIEPDIRLANNWGLILGGGEGMIAGQATFDDSRSSVADGDAANACGKNFAVNTAVTIEGTNAEYTLDCDAYGAGAVAGADTVTVRRAASTTSAAESGRLQVCSNRQNAALFSNGTTFGCPGAPGSRINNVVVDTYYVSQDSTQAAGLPSLRRKALSKSGSEPAFVDEEIIPGIEDLQIQFGVDPTGVSGVATRYVDPDSALASGAQIVAVRIWLLVRAPTPEIGFIDDRVYEYGDRVASAGVTANLNDASKATFAFQPSQSTDTSLTGIKHYRRLLVSRTIQIRNALGT
jgi:type IV pilus assembly protein PilW